MSFVRSRLLAGFALLGAVALIAGCGGGGDSDGLSADEFRQQADAICADAQTKSDALTEPTANDQVLGFLQSGLTIQKAQIAKLKALAAPSDLSGDFGDATGLLDQQVAAISDAADRIEAGEDPTTVINEVSPTLDDLNAQADAKLKALGLTACSSGSSGTDTGTTATAPTTPTAPATDTTATAPSTGTGDTAGYVTDVQAAAGALTEFGTALQSTSSLADLKTKVPEATAALDTFDTAIAKLDTYTLDDDTLDEQRAGLVRTGPKVSDVLRRFLAAAAKGDVAAVGALVPEVTSTIQEFQAAATGG